MAKANRICHTCTTEYYHCPTCPSETKKETFYNMFCCERCSKIFKVLTDETFKHITTAQCKEQLLKLNISVEEHFKDGIKKHVEKVLGYEDPILEIVKETEEIETETITEDESETEKETEKEEEIVVASELNIEEISINEEVIKEETIKRINYVPKKNRKQKNSEVDYK